MAAGVLVAAALACATSAQPIPQDIPNGTDPPASVEEYEEEPAEATELDSTDVEDLLEMDLEQLTRADVVVHSAGDVLNTEVTSVSRREDSIARTPSAVYVVTQEMIRRSGARNVMEILRLVPGVHVARTNGNTWAIGIRGFNGGYTDKLLVQIDGRAIYTPLFSGTLWEQQMVPVEMIERIEVVRGPGATVWGANAVNGVINIVTKHSADTVGLYGEAGGGKEHRSFSYGRAGGQLGQNSTYRVYGTHVDDDGGLPIGGGGDDPRVGEQGGFRVDWRPIESDLVTLQGDFGHVAIGDGIGASDHTVGNFLARWSRQIDEDSDWAVQTYYDNFKGIYAAGSPLLDEVGQNTFDLDSQYHTRLGVHDLVTGFGYRSYETYFHTLPGQAIDFIPDADTFDILSYFVQDTIQLQEDLLFLTLGCKFEHNDFVGFVYQPSVRVAATPNERTSLWGSISRAVRTPSVTNRDLLILSPLGGGQFLRLAGTRAIQAEHALTYEIGLRRQPTERLYWEVAAYFSRYDDLIRSEIVGVAPPFVDATFFNSGAADTYGFEYWATYESAEWQRWRAIYSFFREDFKNGAGSAINNSNVPGTYPRNMCSLISSTDITRRVAFDTIVRYVDALALVDPYLEMDMRLGWSLDNGMEFSVVGRNLLDASHVEFIEPSGIAATSEVERGVFGMLSWEY